MEDESLDSFEICDAGCIGWANCHILSFERWCNCEGAYGPLDQLESKWLSSWNGSSQRRLVPPTRRL